MSTVVHAGLSVPPLAGGPACTSARSAAPRTSVCSLPPRLSATTRSLLLLGTLAGALVLAALPPVPRLRHRRAGRS